MSADQEQALRILDNALWRIISVQGDCNYVDDPKSRPKPCDCPRCVAMAAINAVKGGWRFQGAYFDRIEKGHDPRETKIVEAWKKYAGGHRDPDVVLAHILKEDETAPSARDWYVATSIIQWLATNVGMSILEAAGYKYQQFDQDSEASRLKRATP